MPIYVGDESIGNATNARYSAIYVGDGALSEGGNATLSRRYVGDDLVWQSSRTLIVALGVRLGLFTYRRAFLTVNTGDGLFTKLGGLADSSLIRANSAALSKYQAAIYFAELTAMDRYQLHILNVNDGTLTAQGGTWAVNAQERSGVGLATASDGLHLFTAPMAGQVQQYRITDPTTGEVVAIGGPQSVSHSQLSPLGAGTRDGIVYLNTFVFSANEYQMYLYTVNTTTGALAESISELELASLEYVTGLAGAAGELYGLITADSYIQLCLIDLVNDTLTRIGPQYGLAEFTSEPFSGFYDTGALAAV